MVMMSGNSIEKVEADENYLLVNTPSYNWRVDFALSNQKLKLYAGSLHEGQQEYTWTRWSECESTGNLQSVMQFILNEEKLAAYPSQYRKYVFQIEEYAKTNNIYDLYIEKLQHSIYQKRKNAPTQTLIDGREKFMVCDVLEQCQVLLNIHQVFGRMTAGCDLTLIGGKPYSAATTSFSSTMSNWKKNYTDVRIIDQSASGLWEVVSDNLLEYL